MIDGFGGDSPRQPASRPAAGGVPAEPGRLDQGEPSIEELVDAHASRLLAAARRLSRSEEEARAAVGQTLASLVGTASLGFSPAALERRLVRRLVQVLLGGSRPWASPPGGRELTGRPKPPDRWI